MTDRSRTASWVLCGALLALSVARAQMQAPSLDAQLLEAAGTGNFQAVADLLARGADIEAENWRGATPLCSAAEHGHVEIVKLLIERGANVDARDLEWGRTPLINASVPPSDANFARAEAAITKLLLDKGAGSDGESLVTLIRRGQNDTARAIVARGRVFPSYLNQALAAATRVRQPDSDLVEMLRKAGAKDASPIDAPESAERLGRIAGVYRTASGAELIVRVGLLDADSGTGGRGGGAGGVHELVLQRSARPRVALSPADLSLFRSHDLKTVIRLTGADLPPAELTLRENGRIEQYRRHGDAPAEVLTAAPAAAISRAPRAEARVPPARSLGPGAREWPFFRGPGSSGVLDGASPPVTWNAEKGLNIKWKVAIPGLAHASPVVWGDRVYVTTAVASGAADPFFKTGPGSSSTSESANRSTKDTDPHSWRVYALDKATGKIVWQQVAHEGVPRTARHVNETQANSTPATDGRRLVVFFGSEGLYCYDVNGRLLWKKDLGVLTSGYVMDPTYEWTTASSPIIYKNSVILQVDLIKNSFIAAYDLDTGRQIWLTKRPDEIPSWATPFIYEGPSRTELVTAAGTFARGYDPATGAELWRLAKHAAHVTPTPIAGSGLIFLTSGAGNTIQPIYALRPGAKGNITLGDDEASNEYVVWSKYRGGSYTATPIFYRDLLYICTREGVLRAYRPDTGERAYQVRLPPSEYTASPVAADGKLYYPNVDGDVIVVKAGPKFEQLAVNATEEVIQASPAVTQGMIIFRTPKHVIAVGESTRPDSVR